MAFVGWLFVAAFGFVAFILANSAQKKAARAEEEIRQLRFALENLGRRVAELRKMVASEPAPQPAAAPAPVATVVSEVPQPVVAPPPPSSAPEPPLVVPHRADEASAPLREEAPQPSAAPPPPPPPVQEPPAAAPPHKPPKPPFDWESLIGVKLFAGIAGVALVLAAIFLIRYSVEQGWLRPVVRAAIGILTGSILIWVCELRIARGYKYTANAMHGAAIAILYATLFAMYARWHLLEATLAFGMMVLVTAVAVWLSIRRESVFIALLGLLGGFATPALVSTGENKPIGLFTYLLVLNIGLAWIAMKRRWTILSIVSLVFTAIYQWAWVGKFLTERQLPLAAAIFLVFGLSGAVTLWLRRHDDTKQPTFDRLAVAGAALPLVFALFTAAVPEYGSHYNVLFGFLLLVAAGLAAIAITRALPWLHLLGGVTTLLVFAVWRAASFTPAAWPVVLAWIVAFFGLYLGAGIRFRTPAVYVAALLLFLFPTFVATGDFAASPGLIFSLLFLLAAAAAAFAIFFEAGPLYFASAFAVVATEGIWSGRFLTHDRLLPALVLYAVFALLFLGVPILARRFGRKLQPQRALTVLVLLSIAILFFLDGGTIADASLWGLALMLAVLNAGAIMEARVIGTPVLSIIAAVLSWIVIGVWWGAATVSSSLVPALMVVGLFGVLVIGGNVLAGRNSANAGAFEGSTFLALAGHLFLLFVASQESLAFPPWPLFAILALLDLAIGIAAIYVKRSSLMTAAMAASQAVLFVWATNTHATFFPNVGLAAAIVVVLMAMFWFRLDRRFATSALTAGFLAQAVCMCAGANARPHLFATLLAAHVFVLLMLSVTAWITERHGAIALAALTSILCVVVARNDEPSRDLLFAGVIYALFLAYPLLLGQRAKASLYPYLAPVIASVLFFGCARESLVQAGFKPYIGALPLVQAGLLLVLLRRLLKLERDVERMLSRLALVAGSALAFITIAIPLQLDKEWITIGWALEGAALIWLYRRIPHRGLLLWGGALLSIVFTRLVFNPAVFTYHERSSTRILNWYLYTYLVCAAAMFIATWVAPRVRVALGALCTAGTVLLFLLLNIEIADYYAAGSSVTFNFFSAPLAQMLFYTVGWALFAIGMLIAGIIANERVVRVSAILLLSVTILKCFLLDLSHLGGLYRVGSLLGLAISLVLVGLLLQKFVIRKTEATPA